MTAPFGESCAVCHEEGAEFAVSKTACALERRLNPPETAATPFEQGWPRSFLSLSFHRSTVRVLYLGCDRYVTEWPGR